MIQVGRRVDQRESNAKAQRSNATRYLPKLCPHLPPALVRCWWQLTSRLQSGRPPDRPELANKASTKSRGRREVRPSQSASPFKQSASTGYLKSSRTAAATPTPRLASPSRETAWANGCLLRSPHSLQLHHQRRQQRQQKCAVSRALRPRLLPTMDATSTTSRAGLAANPDQQPLVLAYPATRTRAASHSQKNGAQNHRAVLGDALIRAAGGPRNILTTTPPTRN